MASASVAEASQIELRTFRGVTHRGDHQGLLAELVVVCRSMQVAGNLLGLKRTAEKHAAQADTCKQTSLVTHRKARPLLPAVDIRRWQGHCRRTWR